MENLNPEMLELVNRFNQIVELILEEKIYSEEEINFLLVMLRLGCVRDKFTF